MIMAEEYSSWLLNTPEGFNVLLIISMLSVALIIFNQSSKKLRNGRMLVGMAMCFIVFRNLYHLKFGLPQEQLWIGSFMMITSIFVIGVEIYQKRKSKKYKGKFPLIVKILLIIFLLFNLPLLLFNTAFLVSSYPFINSAEIVYAWITLISGSLLGLTFFFY